MAGTMKAPESGVKIRMYRQGFGDCFLLAFPGKGAGKTTYMLIDCGVKYNSPGVKKMEAVARDIKAATSGRIDIMVVTHEHYDHLAGFDKDKVEEAWKVFKGIRFNEVWAAWMAEFEGSSYRFSPRDALKAQYRALEAAARRLEADGSRAGMAGAGRILGLIKDSRLTADAFEYVLGKVAKPKYLKPGMTPIKRKKLPGVRIFVLGPPKETAYLKDMGTSEESDLYKHLDLRFDGDLVFTASVLALEPGGARSRELRSARPYLNPFAGEYAITPDEAADLEKMARRLGEENGGFFIRNYGFEDGAGKEPNRWRRIDHDWLLAAESLALELKEFVNNTSLVLAIELIDSGKVLLFTADAQAGNLRSMHELSWRLGEETIEAKDLLERTVLYKVGHHGSHNATLKEEGLEMMEHPDLTAMIALTDKAETGVGYNGIPFKPLIDNLKKKTKGRVIRSDHGLPSKKPEELSAEEWNSFKRNTVEKELYIDLTIEN